MNYNKMYNTLSENFKQQNNSFTSGTKIFKISFTSGENFDQNLPDSRKDDNYDLLLNYFLQNNEYSQKYIFRHLSAPDSSFSENIKFDYHVIKADDNKKVESAILLLHGLNERNWNKYLPWGEFLHRTTGKAVILFPLAFHMDRAPVEWSDPRLMNKVSIERAKLIPNVQDTSFANAALSTRLQFAPERLLLSGVQTYKDIVTVLKEIRAGKNEYISPSASLDMFGYSIGAFLGEILLISNPDGLFSNSRLCMFCGGALLDKATPVSKAIIDSAAAKAVLKFYGKENFGKGGTEDISGLLHSFEDVGIYFKSLINSGFYPSLTKSLLNSVREKIKVIGLKKDKVFSEESLRFTFSGGLEKTIDMFDFGYKYSHEKPFPENKKDEEMVNYSFEKVFGSAAAFLT